MAYFRRLAKLLVFPLMCGVSLVVGWLIPAFYDWTGSDQSRSSPLVLPTAVGVLLCGILACLILPWLHLEYDPLTTKRIGKVQFKLRTMLLITAVVAVFLAAFRERPLFAVSCGLLVSAWCYVARLCVTLQSLRWPVASLLACMYFPFAWIVSWSELSNALPALLWMAAGLPAIFFTLLVGGLLHQHPEHLTWLSILLTSAELMIGVWLIRLGPRRFVAYLVFVLIAFIFGSFILNALVRM